MSSSMRTGPCRDLWTYQQRSSQNKSRGSSWRSQRYRYRYRHKEQVLAVRGSQVDRILQSLTWRMSYSRRRISSSCNKLTLGQGLSGLCQVNPPQSSMRQSKPPERLSYMALMTKLINSEPSSFEEYDSIIKSHIWEVVLRPKGKRWWDPDGSTRWSM